ncbi:MAG: LysR family transcriptional regulator [Oligoflexia bacterium]|nr:LysR family transcriptional regulator [Oligoflexia bacterium]
MQKIPLPLFEAILAFADEKNIEAAAKKLGLTQPALSKQLKRLELMLPEPIFFLRGRRKEFTPFGRALCLRLQERLGGIQTAVEEEILLASSATAANIRIAARREVLHRILRISFQGSLSFQESYHEEILQKVSSLEAEVGITYKVPKTYELIAKPLFTEKFQLAIPKSFLSKLSHKSYEQLLEYPCLSYGENDELLEKFFEHHNLRKPNAFRMMEDYAALALMVEKGFGWALLPSYFCPKNSLRIEIARELLPSREFYLIYRSEYKNISWFKNLLKEIQNCF